MKHGVDGILVSNHGARQLDGVPATVCVYAYLFLLFYCGEKCLVLKLAMIRMNCQLETKVPGGNNNKNNNYYTYTFNFVIFLKQPPHLLTVLFVFSPQL